MCHASVFKLTVTVEDDTQGFYSVPLQLYRTDIRNNQGMLVVNLCSAAIGFLHQVSRVGQRQNVSFSTDPICAGPRLAATMLVEAASELCNVELLPAVFELPPPPPVPQLVLAQNVALPPSMAISAGPDSPTREVDQAPSLGSEPNFNALDLNTAAKFNKSDAFYSIQKREHVVDTAALPLSESWFDSSSSSVLLTKSLELPTAAPAKAALHHDEEPPVMVAPIDLSGPVHDAPAHGTAAEGSPDLRCHETIM
jgi:hypothetical protein